MKRILLFFVLIFQMSALKSQVYSYEPMAIESAKWFIKESYVDQNYPWIYHNNRALYGISGDSTLNNVAYKRVFSYDPDSSGNVDSTLIGLIRDDTATRMVYFIHFNYAGYGCAFDCTPFTEMVLYDFSMNLPTDTLVNCPNLGFGTASAQDTSYQFLYGKLRKVINTSSTNTEDFLWYEGIGGQTSPFSRFANGYLGTLPDYTLTDYCIGDLVDCGVAHFLTNSKKVTISSTDIKVFPNPAHHHLNIQTSVSDELNVFIVNAVGQKMDNFLMNNSQTQIDISTYSNGVYYIQFYKDRELVGSEKLVVVK